MSKFITGKELEDAVYNIIWEAKRDLMIVSPYIKLVDYFKNLFEKHLNNPRLHINIIFGKHEGQVSKSFSITDLDSQVTVLERELRLLLIQNSL
ncbi:hypothetical protein [Pontibacter sp. SGAir0037]|uniref:hypothetical protein n=1 Tax=Pontibacter sp. SGAir0037 TaxID=2571030 RepID=UPI00197F24DD|nr:hypothetical protein [Pontibacter sp. SGAir0037]